ncbi:MAG: GNAT family N-acetyltransferase [Alphaproteobacteria bacterium]
MTVLVRKFEEKDMAPVLELCSYVRDFHIKILDGVFKPQADEIEKSILNRVFFDENFIGFVAEKDNEILGYVFAEKRFPPYLLLPHFNIVNIGVSEKAQNLGIGRQLMDVVVSVAKEQGVSEIKLGVYNKNINAHKFYEKYGFEPEEQKMVLKL